MKKTIISLISTCVLMLAGASCTDAQSDHLLFNGVPIDGTIEEMCARLEKKGFELRTSDSTMGMLRGPFADCPECYVGVLGKNGQAATVTVIFPRIDSWNDLSICYYALKADLEKKYGAPTNCTETFVNPAESDDAKIREAVNGCCNFKTVFAAKGGEITLNINGDFKDAYVGLDYKDNANYAKMNETDNRNL